MVYFYTKKDKRVVNHGVCTCAYIDGECRKRYFTAFDLKNNQHVEFRVCDSFFRLEFNRLKKQNDNWMTNQWLAIDLTKSIIKEYIPLGEEIRTRYSNDIIKNTISIVICNNPCIVSNLTFHEAVELSLTNKEIKKRLLEEVNSYVNHIHYKKYKIKYGETIRQCKKLKKMNEHEESYENELNKLLLLILDAQVKVKKKQLK